MKVAKEFLSEAHGGLLDDLKSVGREHYIHEFEGKPAGSILRINGVEFVYYGSLDILGVGQELRVRDMLINNFDKLGYGSPSTRSLVGSSMHSQIETFAAGFKGYTKDAAMLFNTGFTASEAIVEFLVRSPVAFGKRIRAKNRFKTLILHDKVAHASLQGPIAAYKMSLGEQGAELVKSFRHNDYEQLESLLEENKGFDGLILIVCDALYSMDGDWADSAKLTQLAEKYGALVILDGAHSDGVYGMGGSGILSMQGVTDRSRIIEVLTLSKAYASIGGIVCGLPKSTCELIKRSHHRCMFTVAKPTFLVATDMDVMNLVRSEWGDEKRNKVRTVSDFLRMKLREAGFNILKSNSHIIPIVVGPDEQVYKIQRYLFDERRILISAIPQGVVSVGQALLRCSITAHHTMDEVDILVESLKAARDNRRYKFSSPQD